MGFLAEGCSRSFVLVRARSQRLPQRAVGDSSAYARPLTSRLLPTQPPPVLPILLTAERILRPLGAYRVPSPMPMCPSPDCAGAGAGERAGERAAVMSDIWCWAETRTDYLLVLLNCHLYRDMRYVRRRYLNQV